MFSTKKISSEAAQSISHCWLPTGLTLSAYKQRSRYVAVCCLSAAGAGVASVLVPPVAVYLGRGILLAAAAAIGFGIRGWIGMLPLVGRVRQDTRVELKPVTAVEKAATSFVRGTVSGDLLQRVLPSYMPDPPSDDVLIDRLLKKIVRRVLFDTYVFTPGLLAVAILAVLSVARFGWR